jgi:hypothetical protein
MRKLFLLLAVLAVAAFGRQAHLYVGAGTESPDTWDQSAGDAYFAGDLEVDGNCDFDGAVAYDVVTFAADDATPDVSGGTIFETPANSGATAITDLDNPVVGSVITIIIGNAGNPSTIADAGNFNLSAAWNPGLDDSITLYIQADNDYVEIGRSDN